MLEDEARLPFEYPYDSYATRYSGFRIQRAVNFPQHKNHQNLLTPHIIVKISVTELEHFKNVLPCGKEERKQKHKHKLVGQDGCPRVSTQVVYTFSFPMCDCLTYPIYRTK